MTDGAGLIAAERARQRGIFMPEHDAGHTGDELTSAAICYLNAFPPIRARQRRAPALWPWADDWWKPSNDRIRNLVKAGALVAAEIDRLQALERGP